MNSTVVFLCKDVCRVSVPRAEPIGRVPGGPLRNSGVFTLTSSVVD